MGWWRGPVVEEVAGGLASHMATLGTEVGVLVRSVGSWEGTGSGVRGEGRVLGAGRV